MAIIVDLDNVNTNVKFNDSKVSTGSRPDLRILIAKIISGLCGQLSGFLVTSSPGKAVFHGEQK